jgi:hypothetical protein
MCMLTVLDNWSALRLAIRAAAGGETEDETDRLRLFRFSGVEVKANPLLHKNRPF